MNPIVDLIVILAIVAMVFFANLYSLKDTGTATSRWIRLREKIGTFNLLGNRSTVPLPSRFVQPSQDQS